MGRVKLYKNNAEKQKAYRARKRLEQSTELQEIWKEIEWIKARLMQTQYVPPPPPPPGGNGSKVYKRKSVSLKVSKNTDVISELKEIQKNIAAFLVKVDDKDIRRCFNKE